MNSENAKALCLELIKTDSEREEIDLLTEAGYWDDQSVWRVYGGSEYNYSTSERQQRRAE